jgi:hypothetical protein
VVRQVWTPSKPRGEENRAGCGSPPWHRGAACLFPVRPRFGGGHSGRAAVPSPSVEQLHQVLDEAQGVEQLHQVLDEAQGVEQLHQVLDEPLPNRLICPV